MLVNVPVSSMLDLSGSVWGFTLLPVHKPQFGNGVLWVATVATHDEVNHPNSLVYLITPGSWRESYTISISTYIYIYIYHIMYDLHILMIITHSSNLTWHGTLQMMTVSRGMSVATGYLKVAGYQGECPNEKPQIWMGKSTVSVTCFFTIYGRWFRTMEFYDFPSIGNVIIPTDELHHFSEGLKPPTRYVLSGFPVHFPLDPTIDRSFSR